MLFRLRRHSPALVPISFFNRWISGAEATLSPEEGTRLVSQQTTEVDRKQALGDVEVAQIKKLVNVAQSGKR